MSYEFRTYDDDGGDPVVVMVVNGSDDVSRFVNAFARGNCEQVELSQKIARSLNRHNNGKRALALLRDHGGADLTESALDAEAEVEKLTPWVRWIAETHPDDCRYDHHGYCQAHNLDERPCPVEQVKEHLGEWE